MSERVTKWVDGYRKAWLYNEPDDIRALFTENAVYEARESGAIEVQGHDAIVAWWLEHADGPDDTSWEWHHLAEEGDVATVRSLIGYGQDLYDNLWLITFAPDGRATGFTEWYLGGFPAGEG